MTHELSLQDTLALVVDGRDLSREQADRALRFLMGGEATPAQTAALLVALRIKGETRDEITGFAEAMRALATAIPTTRRPLVDTCGTGGDASGTYNISTTAAFIVAGAGVAVAKHGNRSASSKCGSADVLEELGVNLDADPETVGRCIDEIGIGFLFARALHGSMKHVAPVRAELKIRTVFNLLGPLTNPAGADGQVIGVYDRARVADLAQVLVNLGTRHAFVVAGADGLDEITLSGPTLVAEATENGAVKTYEVRPGDFGVDEAQVEALRGGDAPENARIVRSVLEGDAGPCLDIALVNAAAGIRAGGAADTWSEAMGSARASVDSGAAFGKLEQLVKHSKSPVAVQEDRS